MKTIKIFSVAILLMFFTSFRAENLPDTFKELLFLGNLTFEPSAGFKEVGVIENIQMNYEYAIKHTKNKFEIRYAIRPLGELMREYEKFEKNKKPGEIQISPNKLYTTLLQVTALNISGGQEAKITEFNPEAVKTEFNADWGGTTFVKVGKEFGQNYTYCMIVAIHKDNFADAYYFYLSDKTEGFSELMNPAFHSMKFK